LLALLKITPHHFKLIFTIFVSSLALSCSQGHSFKIGEPAPERALVVVAEGAEPEEFWAPIGGKSECATGYCVFVNGTT